MAAYRRVYHLRHLQADCQEPGSAPEPYALYRIWATFTFYTAFDMRLKGRSTPSRFAFGCNNLRQVVHTHVPLSPSSIVRYRSNDSDAMRLGR